MKKKLAWMCMAGVMAMSVSACGGKSGQDAQETAQTVEEGETGAKTEEAVSGESAAETEKISDREDYVGIEDLDIDAFKALALPIQDKFAADNNMTAELEMIRAAAK